MAASALGLLGRSTSVLAASTRSTFVAHASLATATSEGQSSNTFSLESLRLTPISQIPGSAAPDLPEVSAEDLAFVTGAEPPALNKKPVDEADAFASKIGQRLLYGWYDHLRPDIPRLRERPGVEINATSFLLPLPEQIQPNPKLAAELGKQKKGRKEFRRQEFLSGGRLDARFGQTDTWKKVKQRIAQGYTLEQALILHYYDRYGAPKTIEQRRVTLSDIFKRNIDWDWILDRDAYDAQHWRELPTDEDFAGLDATQHGRLVQSFKVQTKFPTFEDYVKPYKDIEADQQLPKLDKIPTWKEIEQMPEEERARHTHAKTEYNKVFEAPLRLGDKFFAYLETAPAFMRKVVHAHMKKVIAATEERMTANNNDPRFPRTGAALKRGEHCDPDLAEKYQAFWHRLGNPEKFDDYKDDPAKITNPDLKRLIE